MSKIFAVDLFSGAGGLSLGFIQTQKVEIVAAVENNKNAKKTYERNHPGVKVLGDVKKLNYSEIKDLCYGLGGERVNLVFGGPPCQGFSNANRQKTELISTNNQLVKEYVKAIEQLNPDAFVMENVKAMKSTKHKFFYTSNDQSLVEELGLSVTTEKIELGKTRTLTGELVAFLQSAIEGHVELKDYVITADVLFSKLSHLTRKQKEFGKYLENYNELITKLSPTWESLHSKYWSETYKQKWLFLGEGLGNFKQEMLPSLLDILKEIIEVQKIMMRVDEIITNKVDTFKLDFDQRHVFIEVKTYNVLDYLISKFKKLNYALNEGNLILNAANFGAPQTRERLFIIGVKEDILRDQKVNLPKPIYTSGFNTVRHAIEDLQEITPQTDVRNDIPIRKRTRSFNNPLAEYLNGNAAEIYNHINTLSRPAALQRFVALKQGENFHHLDESLKQTYSDPRRTQNTVYLKLQYDTPSGTVLNVRKSMWVHPDKPRAISIREAARLQTFPDNFVFLGPKDSQYQQIGNAVPPILGRAVAEKVLAYLGSPVEDPLLLSNVLKPQPNYSIN